MYISLDLAKKHLNIEDTFTLDDEYILGLCSVAENAVEVHCNRPLSEIAERNGGCLPSPLLQAMLLMIGDLYREREPLGKLYALPLSYEYLISLYINYN
jgi:hypothetical protein